jgi:hypothetical protein
VQTIYDWITIAVFAALITLFLNRSTSEEPSDKLIHYAPAAIGCAVINYLGNNGYQILALLLLAALAAYVWFVLKPLAR